MTPTVYVVEGADGVGKSTFAQKVAETSRQQGVPTTVIHNGPPGDIKYLLRLYKLQIDRAIHRRDIFDESTVIDRSFLSELIYGPFRPGGSRITPRQARALERYCKRRGVILLGMTAEDELRERRITARGEKWRPVKDTYFGWKYLTHFRTRNKFWIIADSSSALTVTESN